MSFSLSRWGFYWKFLLVIVILFAVALFPKQLLAQDSTSSDPTVLHTTTSLAVFSSVVTRDILDNEIQEVSRTYGGQLTEYRQLVQQFVVARQEYRQLDTLSSLEVAIQATKKVFLMRDQVLRTYLKLLELKIKNSEGIEIKLKDEALIQIEVVDKSLQRHYEQTQVSDDRSAVFSRAGEFKLISSDFLRVANLSRSLLTLGKIQNIYDKTNSFFFEISSLQQPNTASLSEAQRQRAIDQIDQRLAVTEVTLNEITLKIEKSLTSNSNTRQGSSLSQVYVSINQILGFIEEVIRLSK